MGAEGFYTKSGTAPLLGLSKGQDSASLTSIKRRSDQRTKAKWFHFSGWRMGVTLCASIAETVLIVSITITI